MRQTHCLPVSTLFLMAGCATTFHAGAPPGAVDVIAHRGASAYAPENTLAAFRRAIDLGADWFELDCHLTADQVLVVMHDGDLGRTCTGEGAIRDHTLAEIKALDAGSWFNASFAGEPVPTLLESLELARGRIGVYVEIKSQQDDAELFDALLALSGDQTHLSPTLRQRLVERVNQSGSRNVAIARDVIRLLRKEKLKSEAVIQSFSPIVCFVTLTEAPELRTEFLVSKDKERPERWDQLLAFGRLIGVAGFNAHHEAITPELIESAHRKGRSVAAWTVDDPVEMQRLAGWGIDAIITNKPDVALETLRGLRVHP